MIKRSWVYISAAIALILLLTHILWCHHAISALEARTATIERRATTVRQNSEIMYSLCIRLVTAVEQRQGDLERLVLENDSLGLTLEAIRAYNAGMCAD